MFFSVGVECPKNENEVFGLVIPALCTEEYACFSAAEKETAIQTQAKNAIETMLEVMKDDDQDLSLLQDKGVMHYRDQEDFKHCDLWLLIDVDVESYLNNEKRRLNISLPAYLVERIDCVVANSPIYRDRSYFLNIAARKELMREP